MPARTNSFPFALTVGAACAVLLTAAGCSSGGSASGTAAGPASGTAAAPASSASASQSSGTVSPSKVLALAADNARKITSFTASMDITSTGSYASHLIGTAEEQTKPALLAHQKYSVTSAGTSVPGGMETLLTKDAVYLKMGSLSQALGKPWVGIKFSSLKNVQGINLEPMIHQFQTNNPLAMAQMFPAATNVRRVGSGTVAGVATTEYSGSYKVADALGKIDPGLRKTIESGLMAEGISTAQFTVWVDGQNQVRKVVETDDGKSYHSKTVIVITSINQPVHITVPPASQVATMPGL